MESGYSIRPAYDIVKLAIRRPGLADAGSVTLCRHRASLAVAEIGWHIAGACLRSGVIHTRQVQNVHWPDGNI